MANTDGTLGKYSGGVYETTLIEEGISYDDFVVKVCSRIDISNDGKSFFNSTIRDKSKHLHMRDEDGISMMFHLNEDEVVIYVEEDTFVNPPK